jgi:hypothetical protein
VLELAAIPMQPDPLPAAASPPRLREHRAAGTIAAALLIGVAGFLLRLLASRGLSNDHYMHMAWAQQVLFGAIPGRDFVEVGMPLTIALSAVVQYLAPGPFSEVCLTAAMIGLAAGLTCAAAARLSGSIWIGSAAALFELTLYPRLYNYPKVLVPAATLVVFDWYLRRPSQRRMWPLAVWTLIAVLLRHDLGLYTGIAIAAGLIAAQWPSARAAARALGAFAASTVLVALPYVAFVAATEGIVEHVRAGAEFSAGEAHQLLVAWRSLPQLTLSAVGSDPEAAAAMAFYAAYLLVVVAAFLLPWARSSEARSRAIAAIALLAAYVPIILRHPLTARVPDLGAVIALAAAWTVGESLRALRRRPAGSMSLSTIALAAISVAVVAAHVVSAWTLGQIPDHWKATRLSSGFANASDRLADRKRSGTTWPWEDYWPAGAPPAAIQYLNECTAPTDRFLVSWAAPHYYFFAQRGFAAGHPWFVMRGFQALEDQQLMISRLAAESVPVVLINETDRSFGSAYPAVAEYLAQTYTSVGHYTARGGDEIAVMVRNGVRAVGTHETTGWPCGLEPIS